MNAMTIIMYDLLHYFCKDYILKKPILPLLLHIQQVYNLLCTEIIKINEGLSFLMLSVTNIIHFALEYTILHYHINYDQYQCDKEPIHPNG